MTIDGADSESKALLIQRRFGGVLAKDNDSLAGFPR